MKPILKSIAVVLLVLLPSWKAASQAVDRKDLRDDFGFYEYESGRDESGNVVRGSYVTNQWYDNWSVMLLGGVQGIISEGDLGTFRPTLSLDLDVMKWFTPTIAIRGGVQGLTLREHYPYTFNYNHYQPKHNDEGTMLYYNQTYLHGDFLLNVSNFFWGYKQDRFWSFSPYVHFGYLRLGHPDYGYFNGEYRDREIAFGFGAFNQFRIYNNLSAILDFRSTNFPGRYHKTNGDADVVNNISLSAGICYTIRKWYWVRSTTIGKQADEAVAARVAAEEALAQAERERVQAQVDKEKAEAEFVKANNEKVEAVKQTEQLQQQVKVLVVKVNEYTEIAKANPDDELLGRLAQADFIVYYDKASDKLGDTESIRLDNFIKKVCERDPWHIFYLTGSADAGTGSSATNIKLSKSRAANIKKMLIRKYGIPEGQIVIKNTIVTHKHEDGRLDRCVLIEDK